MTAKGGAPPWVLLSQDSEGFHSYRWVCPIVEQAFLAAGRYADTRCWLLAAEKRLLAPGGGTNLETGCWPLEEKGGLAAGRLHPNKV